MGGFGVQVARALEAALGPLEGRKALASVVRAASHEAARQVTEVRAELLPREHQRAEAAERFYALSCQAKARIRSAKLPSTQGPTTVGLALKAAEAKAAEQKKQT